jgi:hypothetical protein
MNETLTKVDIITRFCGAEYVIPHWNEEKKCIRVAYG